MINVSEMKNVTSETILQDYYGFWLNLLTHNILFLTTKWLNWHWVFKLKSAMILKQI